MSVTAELYQPAQETAIQTRKEYNKGWQVLRVQESTLLIQVCICFHTGTWSPPESSAQCRVFLFTISGE